MFFKCLNICYFFFKILLALNNICFVNNNVLKPEIKSIFLILNYFLSKTRLGLKYNFWEYKNDIISTFVYQAPDAKIFS